MSNQPHDALAAYLADVVRTYRNYKKLGDAAIARVPDRHLLTEIDPQSNSVAVIVKHVGGNLRSRFTDFLTTDGEKPDRNRDGEFEAGSHVTRDEVLAWWELGWAAVLEVLDALTPSDLSRTITIRGEAFQVIEALNRSATHTAYHVGQIVYLARHFAGDTWTSLSVPKGESAKLAVGDFKSKGIARP